MGLSLATMSRHSRDVNTTAGRQFLFMLFG